MFRALLQRSLCEVVIKVNDNQERSRPGCHARCCPCETHEGEEASAITRRGFLGGTAMAGLALSGVSWSALSAAESGEEPAPARRPLIIKPVFVHHLSPRAPQTS